MDNVGEVLAIWLQMRSPLSLHCLWDRGRHPSRPLTIVVQHRQKETEARERSRHRHLAPPQILPLRRPSSNLRTPSRYLLHLARPAIRLEKQCDRVRPPSLQRSRRCPRHRCHRRCHHDGRRRIRCANVQGESEC